MNTVALFIVLVGVDAIDVTVFGATIEIKEVYVKAFVTVVGVEVTDVIVFVLASIPVPQTTPSVITAIIAIVDMTSTTIHAAIFPPSRLT